MSITNRHLNFFELLSFHAFELLQFTPTWDLKCVPGMLKCKEEEENNREDQQQQESE